MNRQRVIEVKKQQRLSLAKTARLCLSGISHRLLRSLLTLAVVVLAVAFFMTLLCESSLLQRVGRGVSRELLDRREAATLLGRLFSPPASVAQARRLALYAGDHTVLAEFARVTGWEEARVEALASGAQTEGALLDFFAGLSAGQRAMLVRKAEGRGAIGHLLEPENLASFWTALSAVTSLRPPLSREELSAYLEGYRAYEAELESFTGAWRAAVERFEMASRELTGTAPIERWLMEADAAELAAWHERVRQAGFTLEAATLERVRERLRLESSLARVEERLRSDEGREAWLRAFRRKATLDRMLGELSHPAMASFLADEFDAARLGELERDLRRGQRLSRAEGLLTGRVDLSGDGGLSGRQAFLLFISFLVCLVGITNAMLMAITERFREIATMKCLGATDGYILNQFMIEAALQGVVGGVLGMLIGLLLAVIKSALGLGGFVFEFFPWGAVALAGLYSMAAGVVVSTLASIYPSATAARMAPMEAMRVE